VNAGERSNAGRLASDDERRRTERIGVRAPPPRAVTIAFRVDEDLIASCAPLPPKRLGIDLPLSSPTATRRCRGYRRGLNGWSTSPAS
jgi:hypothetical protein